MQENSRVSQREFLMGAFHKVLTKGFIELGENQSQDPFSFLVKLTRRIMSTSTVFRIWIVI